MALDPRIALQGASFQAPDFLGAMRQGQEIRQNQMAQQAAQATAELNRNAMNDAALLDPNDRAAQQQYALRYGAAATPFLTALSGVDTNFAGRGTERRAEGEFATKQSEAYMEQLPRFAAQLLGDASPARRAAVRQMAIDSGFPVAQYDALDTQLAGLDPAAQQQTLQSFLLTTGGGKAVVDARFPDRELAETATGREAVNLSSLALDPVTGARVPITGPLTRPAEKPVGVVNTEKGMVAYYADGRTELLQAPSGGPLQEGLSPADQRAQAAAEAEAAAETARVAQMAQANLTSVQNTRTVIADAIPNVGVWTAGLGSLLEVVPGTPAADLAGAIETLEANLSFEKLAEMRANSPTGGALGNITNTELRLLGASMRSLRQSQSPEQLRENMRAIDASLARLEAAYAAAGRASPVSGGGDISALETEARRRGLIP